MKDVESFLKRFHLSENVDEVFTCGCCYWFAAVLFGRFIRDGATIMYDEVANHFGTRIKCKVYDSPAMSQTNINGFLGNPSRTVLLERGLFVTALCFNNL